MILLQTLSRLHVCATLAFAQVIGSICVMAARATAPNRIGPGSVFPDVGTWDFSQGLSGSPMASAPFWIALICQIVIVLGYFWFYRKEQLGKSSCVEHSIWLVTDRFFSSTIILLSSPKHTRITTQRTCFLWILLVFVCFLSLVSGIIGLYSHILLELRTQPKTYIHYHQCDICAHTKDFIYLYRSVFSVLDSCTTYIILHIQPQYITRGTDSFMYMRSLKEKFICRLEQLKGTFHVCAKEVLVEVSLITKGTQYGNNTR
jgi:hypothetical protein